MKPSVLVIQLACLLLPCSVAAGSPSGQPHRLPDPLGYVSDFAGALDADWRARVRSVCQDLERKTGVELVVVTVHASAPLPNAQAYASALYEQWGIGTAQQDYGMLMLAVVGERQASVTLGRSLIPVISPKVLEEIGSRYLEPAYRNGRIGEGLYRATVALASASQDIRVNAPKPKRSRGLGVVLTAGMFSLLLFFLWWISRPDRRHPFPRLRRGEYWGSGQGGFGGNFGGFGGGMSGEGLK